MTIPGSAPFASAPYGAQPVIPVVGPEGGPYDVAGPRVVTMFTLASRTAGGNTAVQINSGYRGALFRFNVTVNPGGAQTLGPTFFGWDPVLSAAYAIMTVPPSATPGGVFLLYPGASGATVEGVSVTRNLALPDQFYCNMGHSGSGAWTYSLTAVLLP